MKLMLSKEQQKKGMMGGKMIYTLTIKADLTDQEKHNLEKYGMTNELLYSDVEGDPASSVWKSIKTIATATTIKVSDLSQGKTIECKDFIEIVTVEERVIAASKTLKNLLDAMANFEGEQVINIE